MLEVPEQREVADKAASVLAQLRGLVSALSPIGCRDIDSVSAPRRVGGQQSAAAGTDGGRRHGTRAECR